jgi:YesN/AraC family two-component response regulator
MYRLLIADDEEEIRNGLADCFPWGEVGFRVTARAENGKRALEIIEHEEVDAVLTDIRMPLMSGIDLARHIFERHLDLPVVFLSAYKDFAYAQKAIQYGVRRYVLKPTDYSELASVLSALKRELDSGISPATPDALAPIWWPTAVAAWRAAGTASMAVGEVGGPARSETSKRTVRPSVLTNWAAAR